MLATFVIGLREGLEAALIVGIIAAFLRKNGKSLTAMWAGVFLAVLLSVIVGVVLEMTEHALPQASQEGMEAIIGAVAVFFVTGMIMWMNTHAHNMKRALENEAAQAISQSSAWALASMAFLAVLKEGFETSVFLLATFSVAQSAAWAAIGAVIGLIMAVIIGCGIYFGGVRINLSRFFRFTGLFLILVAGGLIITSLRSAHEAGWLNIGQERIANLSWLVPPGSIQSALITGVLGIPADPCLIEVLGWFFYIATVVLFIYWPSDRRPSTKVAVRWLLSSALVLALSALSLFLYYPKPTLQIPNTAPLVSNETQNPAGQLTLLKKADNGYQLNVISTGSKPRILNLSTDAQVKSNHDGFVVETWSIRRSLTPEDAPKVLTLDQVVELYGNRIPIGLNPSQHPGPYQAEWTVHCAIDVSIAQGVLLNASGHSDDVVTLSGSGLQSPRTVTARNDKPMSACHWQVARAYRQNVEAALQRMQTLQDSSRFWAVILPLFLTVLALIFVFCALRMSWTHHKQRQPISAKNSLLFSPAKSTTLPENNQRK
ncbi:iron uptake transporter permease EfeU [Pectobacteriaceae bacterium CE70]|nr:iron uptake transporter permease EfeU [Pectobacteriaceae bacterium C52]WJV66413.1 iron uptake transporter permease EfeU [Pectobacteriaceae bacterium CE70]WJY10419.1 iron uptake transporter permease EfeU [Pectobacteriaceae bacterium C80]